MLDWGFTGYITLKQLSSSGRQSSPQTITVEQGRHSDSKRKGSWGTWVSRGPRGSQGWKKAGEASRG